MDSRLKKALGLVLALSLLTVWAFIDLLILSSFIIGFSYPIFEIATYGSWFVVILLALAIISWAGCIPERKPD